MADHLPAELAEVMMHRTERALPHVHLHLCVDLDRRFGRDDLEAAARRTIETFPVLGCVYRARWWRDRWVAWEGEVADLVHVEQTDDVEASTRRHVARTLDHVHEPTWRLASLEAGEGSRLIITLHHMTGDGGSVKALAAVVVASLCGVDPVPAPTADRRIRALAWALRLRDLPVLAVELVREGLQPLSVLRVRRLSPFPRGDGSATPRWTTVRLEGEAARGWVAGCKAAGATINDGVVATVVRLAAERGERGPVAAGYTIDLRRTLPTASRVTNLAGVTLVTLPRRLTGSREQTLDAVCRRIGEQKRRLPGLAYTLLPLFAIGWLPHGLLRLAGRLVLNNILSYLNRALGMTNIGPLDDALAPLGASAKAASIVGPFVHGLPCPITTVTGFRGSLTLQVQSTGTLAPAAIDDLAERLGRELAEASGA